MSLFGGNPLDKIAKLTEKGKSSGIISAISKKGVSKEVLEKGLEALGKIGDEDAINTISALLDSPDSDVRVAAAKAGIATGTEYMKTAIQQLLAKEKDADVVKKIREAYEAKFVKK